MHDMRVLAGIVGIAAFGLAAMPMERQRYLYERPVERNYGVKGKKNSRKNRKNRKNRGKKR